MLKQVSYADLDSARYPMTKEGLKAAQKLIELVESNLWRGISVGDITIASKEAGYEVHFTSKDYVAFAKSALERAILATNDLGEFEPARDLKDSSSLPRVVGKP